jgi:hypothetical protein
MNWGGGTTMDEMPTEDELTAYVGSAGKHYLAGWRPALSEQGKIGGFNIGAFFFSTMWQAYRKMYWYALLVSGILVASTIVEAIIFLGVLRYKVMPPYPGYVVGLILCVTCGIYGNRWYFYSARRAIARVHALGLSQEDSLKLIARRGGVNPLGALWFFLLYFVINSLAMFSVAFIIGIVFYTAPVAVAPVPSTPLFPATPQTLPEQPTGTAGAPSETPVTQIDYSTWISNTFTISPDGRRAAYVARQSDAFVVVVDGQMEGPFLQVGTGDGGGMPFFSPDSRHLAYEVFARLDQGIGWFSVVDGRAEGPYDNLGAFSTTFSPDSQHIAYAALRGGRRFVVIDGKPQQGYDAAEYPQFSPDGQHVVYAAQKGTRWFAVLDGQEGKPYDDACLHCAAFSQDSRHVAYLAHDQHGWFIVVDDKEGTRYEDVDRPVFSPDSQHVAYAAKTGGKYAVVVDGKEGTRYDSVQEVTFSPDSQHVAYGARDGNSWFVVADGKAGRPYDHVGAGSVRFSSDSQSMTYLAGQGNTAFAVEGEQVRGAYDNAGAIVFSPDRQHVAHCASMGNSAFVVLDDQQQQPYDIVGKPVFSPDGRHLAYMGRKGDERYVVVDGKQGNPYDFILSTDQGGIYFDSANSFHYLAERGDKIVLVEEKIG